MNWYLKRQLAGELVEVEMVLVRVSLNLLFSSLFALVSHDFDEVPPPLLLEGAGLDGPGLEAAGREVPVARPVDEGDELGLEVSRPLPIEIPLFLELESLPLEAGTLLFAFALVAALELLFNSAFPSVLPNWALEGNEFEPANAGFPEFLSTSTTGFLIT
jgi:hypothetical protein